MITKEVLDQLIKLEGTVTGVDRSDLVVMMLIGELSSTNTVLRNIASSLDNIDKLHQREAEGGGK